MLTKAMAVEKHPQSRRVPVRRRPEMGMNVEDAMGGVSTELAVCAVDGGVERDPKKDHGSAVSVEV